MRPFLDGALASTPPGAVVAKAVFEKPDGPWLLEA